MVLLRIGGLLTLLGFGSLVLNLMNREFTLLSWAEDYQPTLGLIMGIAGVALIVIALVVQNDKKAPRA
jgi:hypothetical protein